MVFLFLELGFLWSVNETENLNVLCCFCLVISVSLFLFAPIEMGFDRCLC